MIKKQENIWSTAREKQINEAKRDSSIKKKSASKATLSLELNSKVMDEKLKIKNKKLEAKKPLTNDKLDKKILASNRINNKKTSKKKLKILSPFNKKGWRLIVIIMIIMVLIVVLPIAFIFGAGSAMINEGRSLYMSNGFVTKNNSRPFEETRFSLQHVGTGKYIDFPTTNINNDFPLTLTTDPQNYNFVLNGEEFNNNILKTDDLSLKLVTGPYFLVSGSEPKLAKQPKNMEDSKWHKKTQIGLHKDGRKDRFSIYSKSAKKFLGNPDKNDQIFWSTSPVFWKMEAKDKSSIGKEILEIKTPDQFKSEFWDQEELIGKPGFSNGANGRTMSMQSTITGDYLNTKDFVGEFYNEKTKTVEFKQSPKDIKTKNTENFNLFMPDVLQDKIQLGSFINNTIDIRTSSPSPTSSADLFPVLVANEDEVKLETRSNKNNEWNTWKESFITLKRSPLDLRKFSINFKDIDGTDRFLSTRNGKAKIEHGNLVKKKNYTPEYFKFNTSSNNSENLIAKVIKTTKNSGTYRVNTLNSENNIYKLQFRARSYSTNAAGEQILLDDTKWKSYKLIGGSSKIRINNLRNNIKYDWVEMRAIRDNDSANHVTTYRVDGFETKKWDWPSIPDPGDDLAENLSLEEKELELQDNPGKNITAHLDFQNGEGTQKVTKIQLLAYELDGTLKKVGPPKSKSKSLPSDGDIEFKFSGLKPETSYWFTTKYTTIGNFNDEEQDDTNGIPEASPPGAASGTYSMTVKTHRLLPKGEVRDVKLITDANSEKLSIKLYLDKRTVRFWNDNDPGDDYMINVKRGEDEIYNISPKKVIKWDADFILIELPNQHLIKGDNITISTKIKMNGYDLDNQIYVPVGVDRFEIHSLQVEL